MKSRIIVSLGIIIILVLVGLVGNAIISSEEQTVQAYKDDNLIRLHIVANSNTIEDQALKLQIRDRLIKETKQLFLGVEDIDEAHRIIEENLDKMFAIAREVITDNGKDYDVEVRIGREEF